MTDKAKIATGDHLNISALFRYYASYWWVFLISIFILCGLATIYAILKSPQYAVSTSLILNDNDDNPSGALGGGLGALMSSFSLGGLGYRSTEDEMYKLGSHTTMTDAVKRLGLHKGYWSKASLLEPKQWYYNDSPIEVQVPDAVLDTISRTTEFEINVRDNGRNIRVRAKQGKEKVFDKEFHSFPITVSTPLATFRLVTTPYYDPSEDLNLFARAHNPQTKAIALEKEVVLNQYSKKSGIIIMYYKDAQPERAMDLLNTMIAVYNDHSIDDRRRFADSTVNFLDARLIDVYADLRESEAKIEEYKRTHKIVDPNAEASYIFNQKGSVDGNLIQLETRASVTQMIIDFLNSSENKYQLIPFTEDIPDAPITAYNELVLKRITLSANAKENNTVLKNITNQIDAMRANLLSSLERNLAATKIGISELKNVASLSDSRIDQAPTMEKELTAMTRDNIIKNQIYAFLLQKREENELKRSRTLPVGKVIEYAYTDYEPVGPGKAVIFGGAFLLALLIPGLILLLRLKRQERNANVA